MVSLSEHIFEALRYILYHFGDILVSVVKN